MSEEFKPGDTVQLKSGGPVMTVRGKSAWTDDLVCDWFEKTKNMSATFAPAVLKPYQPQGLSFATVTRG